MGTGGCKNCSGRLGNGFSRQQNDAGRLDDGLKRLPNGSGRLEHGLGRLEKGSGRLENGFKRLENGPRRLQHGFGRLEMWLHRLENSPRRLENGRACCKSVCFASVLGVLGRKPACFLSFGVQGGKAPGPGISPSTVQQNYLVLTSVACHDPGAAPGTAAATRARALQSAA